jgi:hypothetical protein
VLKINFIIPILHFHLPPLKSILALSNAIAGIVTGNCVSATIKKHLSLHTGIARRSAVKYYYFNKNP